MELTKKLRQVQVFLKQAEGMRNSVQMWGDKASAESIEKRILDKYLKKIDTANMESYRVECFYESVVYLDSDDDSKNQSKD